MKGIGAGLFALTLLAVTACLALGVHAGQLFIG